MPYIQHDTNKASEDLPMDAFLVWKSNWFARRAAVILLGRVPTHHIALGHASPGSYSSGYCFSLLLSPWVPDDPSWVSATACLPIKETRLVMFDWAVMEPCGRMMNRKTHDDVASLRYGIDSTRKRFSVWPFFAVPSVMRQISTRSNKPGYRTHARLDMEQIALPVRQ